MATRWGIVSAGRVCSDFVTALELLPSKDHQVVAVAARNLDKAKQFAKRFDIPKAYGSYEELSKDPDVEVAYIGSIHLYHADLCKMMLRAGKHVLCEKPLCMNEREVVEVIQVARENKRFLMECFWSRFFPAYHRMREEVAKGTVGDVQVISASIGFYNDPSSERFNHRRAELALGGGALMDFGCYAVQFAEQFLGGKPEKVSASGVLQKSGTDLSTVITLTYPGGKMAVLTTTVGAKLGQTGYIQGTKGVIKAPLFWCPPQITVNDEVLDFPRPTTDKPLNASNSAGFTYEAQHVREMLLKGALESPIMPLESSLNIIRIMDEARRQLGVTYESDRA